MSELKKEYDETTEQRVAVIDELKQLENDELVKRYLELKKENYNLYDKQLRLYGSIKKEEYDECKHILVYSKIDYDRYEGRTYRSCGCIKCGLDNSVLDKEREWLTPTQKIMYDYLRKNHLNYFNGIKIDILCDIDLATSIYSKIKDANPDIDDETAIKYFEIALHNIRNIEVNDERKISRAKRLSLSPKFKRWNGRDICND